MLHSIFINQVGIIEIIFDGELNFKDNLEIGKRILTLTTNIRDLGKHAKLLVDFTKLTDRNPLTTRLNIAIVRDLEPVKIAGFGADLQTTKDMLQITTETNTKDRVRLFGSRHEAEDWLG